MRTHRRLIGILLVAALQAGVVQAQGGPGPGPDGPPRRGRGDGERPRDDAGKIVDAWIISNLQESLNLDEAQFARMIPLIKKLQTDRRNLGQRRMESMRELGRLLGSGGATEARVGELLRELKAVEVEEPATVKKDRDAIDAALTPLQQAKYRVLEGQVEFRIRELMGQIRHDAGGGRPMGRGQGRHPDGRRPDHQPQPPPGSPD